jgi:hypothetical protein
MKTRKVTPPKQADMHGSGCSGLVAIQTTCVPELQPEASSNHAGSDGAHDVKINIQRLCVRRQRVLSRLGGIGADTNTSLKDVSGLIYRGGMRQFDLTHRAAAFPSRSCSMEMPRRHTSGGCR